MPTRIRFRDDSAFAAEDAARRSRGEETLYFNPGEDALESTPPAEPGDTWRLRWSPGEGETEGPIAGYAVCCSKCKLVHRWTSALGCNPCPHKGKSSCWTWTGNPEDGSLTASPSLHCVSEWQGKPTGGCGYHGFLQNGVLSDG